VLAVEDGMPGGQVATEAERADLFGRVLLGKQAVEVVAGELAGLLDAERWRQACLTS